MDRDITQLAASQHGAFSRRQARAAGLSRSAIGHRLRRGLWVELHDGVYAIAGAPRTERSEVMRVVLSAGTSAVATASTALALHGIRDFRLLPARVAVARRPPRSALPGVVETFHLPEGHRTAVDGIPCATIARALFDHAGTVRKQRLARALDAALAARRVTLAELDTVITELAEHGRRGSAVMRELVEERGHGYVAPTTELEARFLELVIGAGIPEPARQVDLGGALAWIGRVDFVWRAERVIVETDGASFHNSVTDREDDERRDRALEQAGWTVLRFGWLDVTKRPTSVCRTVRSALALAA